MDKYLFFMSDSDLNNFFSGPFSNTYQAPWLEIREEESSNVEN